MIRLGNGFPTYGWEVNLAGREAPAEKRKTEMKNNLRGKIRDFVQSEEGKVGVKSPLTLGAAVGSVLLAQAIVGTPEADAIPCREHGDCPNRPWKCHPSGSCVSP